MTKFAGAAQQLCDSRKDALLQHPFLGPPSRNPGLVWSHYPPAIKRGNGKSPRNGGLDGKIVLLLLTPCMDGQQRLRTPGNPKFCPWLQRVTPVVHSKPAAGFKEPHGPGPRDHLVITGWSGRGWITTWRRKRSSLARFQCWGYSIVSWLPI